jgi:hypothetical protein
MPTCKTCGKSVGIFTSQCDACKQQEVDAQRLAADSAAAKAQHDLDEKRVAYVEACRRRIEATMASSRPAYLFEFAYVPVDSTVQGVAVGTFNMQEVRELGWDGWDLVAVIPKTEGHGLSNTAGGSNSSWGGGMGGNVVGVYAVLRYSLTQRDSAEAAEVLDAYLMRDVDRSLGRTAPPH